MPQFQLPWLTSGPASLQIFDRLPSLQGCQIINYRSAADGKWLVLVGIGANKDPAGFKVKGSMQLYSRDRESWLARMLALLDERPLSRPLSPRSFPPSPSQARSRSPSRDMLLPSRRSSRTGPPTLPSSSPSPSGRPREPRYVVALVACMQREPTRALFPSLDRRVRGQTEWISDTHTHAPPPFSPPAPHRRGRPPGTKPAVPEEGGRRLLPARGGQRLPRRNADLAEARHHLPRHQVRLHPPLRPRVGHVHLHEPHLRRDHLCHG